MKSLINRKVKKAENGDGGGGTSPSAKPSKYRTDYKPKSKYRTKWEQGKFKHPEKEAFTERDIQTPYASNPDVQHLKNEKDIEMGGKDFTCANCGEIIKYDEKNLPKAITCPECGWKKRIGVVQAAHDYCRELYKETMNDVKKLVSKDVIKSAYALQSGQPGHYAFHIGDDYYWYGQADCVSHAKAEGWDSYLRERFPEQDKLSYKILRAMADMSPKEHQAYTCIMEKGEEECRSEFGDLTIDKLIDQIVTPASKIETSKRKADIVEKDLVQFKLPDKGIIVGYVESIQGDVITIRGLDNEGYSIPKHFIDKVFTEKERYSVKKKSYNELKKKAINVSFVLKQFGNALKQMCPGRDEPCFRNSTTKALNKAMAMYPNVDMSAKQEILDRIKMKGYSIVPGLVASKQSYNSLKKTAKYKLITVEGEVSERDDLTLEEMQEFVGGYIEEVGQFIVNEEGRMKELPANKVYPQYVGNVIIREASKQGEQNVKSYNQLKKTAQTPAYDKNGKNILPGNTIIDDDGKRWVIDSIDNFEETLKIHDEDEIETKTLSYSDLNHFKSASKKTAQDPTDEDELEEDEDEEDILLDEELPIGDEDFPEGEGELGEDEEEIVPELLRPDILNLITPMDMQLMTRLEDDRENAIAVGDLRVKQRIDKEIDAIIEKYVTPTPVNEMGSNAFVSRLMKGHLALQRDMIPLIERASGPVKKLQEVLPISIGQVSFAALHTDEYDPVPKNGWVEWVISVRKIGAIAPPKRGVIRVNVHGDTAEVVPAIWDMMGHKYHLDEDGVQLFLGLKAADEIKNLEENYMKEEQDIRNKMEHGQLDLGVYGIGDKPQTPSDKGITAPKTNYP